MMDDDAIWYALIVGGTAVWTLVIVGAIHLSFDVLDYVSEWRAPVNLEAQP